MTAAIQGEPRGESPTARCPKPTRRNAGFPRGGCLPFSQAVFSADNVYDAVRMIDLIEQHRQRIHDLCRRYRVTKLDVFGSAVSGEFDPVRSDVDFFYEFDRGDLADLSDRFFNLKDELESLLGRRC